MSHCVYRKRSLLWDLGGLDFEQLIIRRETVLDGSFVVDEVLLLTLINPSQHSIGTPFRSISPSNLSATILLFGLP